MKWKNKTKHGSASIICIKHINIWALRGSQSEYFSMAMPSLLVSWWLQTYSLWHVPTPVCVHAKVLLWELLTAPLWRRVAFSWHGSRSQNPWALKADASTAAAPVNVFSRGKGRKCFCAFLTNGAWLTAFGPYVAAASDTAKMCVCKRIGGIFSSNIVYGFFF